MKSLNVESVLVSYQSAEYPYRAGYRMVYEAESPRFVDAWLGMYTELGQLEKPNIDISWNEFKDGTLFPVIQFEDDVVLSI